MKWLKKVAATPLTSIAKVIDNLNTQTNDRTNAPSIHAVREAVNNNWLSIYPIGSIYMSVNNVNPSEIFGGTWQQIKDKFLLACGDTYNNGATGGSATHTPSGTVEGHKLTYEEAAIAHVHNVNGIGRNGFNLARYVNDNAQDGFIYTANLPNEGVGLVAGGNNISTQTTSFGYEENEIAAHSHGFTGNSQDTMPPYLAVNVWVRTA
jgi:hypothetical protein